MIQTPAWNGIQAMTVQTAVAPAMITAKLLNLVTVQIIKTMTVMVILTYQTQTVAQMSALPVPPSVQVMCFRPVAIMIQTPAWNGT
ncbi:MAG: hypothetical protein DRH04_04540 [Deltaproteobacteria bacterium]|nr:MAG: hypothetical protein DRH04_04540 [Deltaproteobacteria bacterium]